MTTSSPFVELVDDQGRAPKMAQEEGQTPGRVVQVTCVGTLPAGHRTEFAGWDVASTGGTTVLIGHDVDQAALHGTLDRLFMLNMHVNEVSRRPSALGVPLSHP